MDEDLIFNVEQLMNSTCDDRELAAQVVGVFVGDFPKQIAEIEQALASGDLKTAERHAHSIKGASATVGGAVLSKTALACEQLGNAGDAEGFRALLPELRRDFDALRAELVAVGLADG